MKYITNDIATKIIAETNNNPTIILFINILNNYDFSIKINKFNFDKHLINLIQYISTS